MAGTEKDITIQCINCCGNSEKESMNWAAGNGEKKKNAVGEEVTFSSILKNA